MSAIAWSLSPRRPVLGQLSQGVVFTCARAEDYPRCAVHGLTITARCDIAHDKAKVYSYLPIVSLRDWWHHDGADILINRARRQQAGQIRTCLRDCGFTENVLSIHSPRAVLQTLFPANAAGPPAKARSRVVTAVKWIEELDERHLPVSTAHLQRLCQEFKALRRTLMDELMDGRLAGFYFLPQVAFEGDDLGFVLSLREVRHLPRGIATRVGAGLQKPADEIGLAELSQHLSFVDEDFAMPVGIIPSPLIEQVMQAFSLLFSRIGVDDLPRDYVTSLWNRLSIDAQV